MQNSKIHVGVTKQTWPLPGKLKLPGSMDWVSVISISESPIGMPNIMPWTAVSLGVFYAATLGITRGINLND